MNARRSNPVKTILLYVALLAFAVLFIYPFLIQIATSFKTDGDATGNPTSLVPGTVTYAAYDILFASDLPFPTWAMNSVIVTLVVTAGRVLFCSAAGRCLKSMISMQKLVVRAVSALSVLA